VIDKHTTAFLAAVFALALPCAGAERAVGVGDLREVRESYQSAAQASQGRIEALDDETVALLATYNRELDRLEDLTSYNANLRELLTSQQAERAQLEDEIKEIEVVKRAVVPLMQEMTDVLAQLIDLDQPLLADERRARLSALEQNLVRSDIDLAEKYRRLIEAYLIESEYGQTIEAYEGTLLRDGRELTVDYLHVGRVALYYMTFDRSEAAIWNPRERVWQSLPATALDDLDYAVRVARKQAPPDLMPLTLWTPGQ